MEAEREKSESEKKEKKEQRRDGAREKKSERAAMRSRVIKGEEDR